MLSVHGETTHETTTTTTSPAHWWRRYMCPDCSGVYGEHPVELETDDGGWYTCPVCGCSTSYPEDDACPEIRDAWAEALDILDDEGAEILDADGDQITIERYTADLGGDQIHIMTITDREDAYEIARAFDELYEEFDPWREAHIWMDEEGNPRENVPTTSGQRLWADMQEHDAWLRRVSDRMDHMAREHTAA